jgi:hypothetical protein
MPRMLRRMAVYSSVWPKVATGNLTMILRTAKSLPIFVIAQSLPMAMRILWTICFPRDGILVFTAIET